MQFWDHENFDVGTDRIVFLKKIKFLSSSLEYCDGMSIGMKITAYQDDHKKTYRELLEAFDSKLKIKYISLLVRSILQIS